jgi:dUTP pyrophosphatase
MEREQIEEYIKRLKELESDMSGESEDMIDNNFIEDLDKLLKNLSTDIGSSFGPQSLKIPVRFKKLHNLAITPRYSKDGDAGMDLTITSIISETKTDVTYGFGIAIEIPKGYVGLLFPRSSVRKYDLSLTNSVGVIDSGYRGEIQATFKKTNWLKGSESEKYNVGERGAQIIILPYPQIEFIETDNLSETERGEGGFGSSGL